MSKFRLARHRTEYNFWPSFVDALSTLLIVVLFFLLLFVLAHFFLGRNLDTKNNEIFRLNEELSSLANELAVEKKNVQELSVSLNEKINAEKQLISELDLLKADHDKTQKTLEETLKQAALLQQDIKALTQRRDALEKENAKHQTDLKNERKISEDAKVHIALLTSRIEKMNAELAKLSATLEASEELSKRQKAQIVDLGKKLNRALAQKASELSYYRSDFFGTLRKILEDRKDIRIEGDRFVFQSELFFKTGSAELEPKGKKQLKILAQTLLKISKKIPAKIQWVLRVDGHTDNVPIKNEKYASNWELSSARAIAVVQYLISQGVPPKRLVAAGFGEHQPLSSGNSEKARKNNRRIEFKLTER